MARIDVVDGDGLERERLLMMQPDVAKGMWVFAKAVYEKSSLPARLREIARLRVAVANGCRVCLNTRSPKSCRAGARRGGRLGGHDLLDRCGGRYRGSDRA